MDLPPGGAAAGAPQQDPATGEDGRARAARLLDEVLSAAPFAGRDLARVLALAGAAGVLARGDPDRAATLADEARHVARALTSPGQTALGLVSVAVALAQTDPGRAGRLAGDAVGAARSVIDARARVDALARLAEAVAGFDPDRAERIARLLSAEDDRANALGAIAAGTLRDPDDETADPARRSRGAGEAMLTVWFGA